VRKKTRYLVNGNFAGIMAWEISMDAPYNSGYSLTRSIVEEAGR
jgi:GH18 family chitinase